MYFIRLVHNSKFKILKYLFYFHLLVGFFCFVSIFLDPKTFNNSIAWIKPFKFSISISIFLITYIWMIQFTNDLDNFFSKVNLIFTIGFFLETLGILIQVFKNTGSHFNISSTLNKIIFTSMGIVITIITISYFFTGYKIFKKGTGLISRDNAIIYSVIISTIAMFSGFIMTSTPTEKQKQIILNGSIPETFGSHSVGGEDDDTNSKRLTFVGWRLDIGDLRVAHFFGIHSMQIIPLFEFILRRRKIHKENLFILKIFSLFYGIIFLFFLIQALMKKPFFNII